MRIRSIFEYISRRDCGSGEVAGLPPFTTVTSPILARYNTALRKRVRKHGVGTRQLVYDTVSTRR